MCRPHRKSQPISRKKNHCDRRHSHEGRNAAATGHVGLIGAQAVGGCVDDVKDPPRLSPASKMIETLTKNKQLDQAFFELYLVDAKAATYKDTAIGRELANGIAALNWQPTP